MLYDPGISVQALMAHGWSVAISWVLCLSPRSAKRKRVHTKTSSPVTKQLKPPQREPEFSWLISSTTSLHASLKTISVTLPTFWQSGLPKETGTTVVLPGPRWSQRWWSSCLVQSSQQTGPWNLVLSPANITTTNNQFQPKQPLLLLPFHKSSSCTTNGPLNSGCCWRLDKQFRGNYQLSSLPFPSLLAWHRSYAPSV